MSDLQVVGRELTYAMMLEGTKALEDHVNLPSSFDAKICMQEIWDAFLSVAPGYSTVEIKDAELPEPVAAVIEAARVVNLHCVGIAQNYAAQNGDTLYRDYMPRDVAGARELDEAFQQLSEWHKDERDRFDYYHPGADR